MIRWGVQMAVLAALIVVFGLQIPRSALFFRPAKSAPTVAHAAFVTLDDAAYLRLMRQVRTTEWSGGSLNWNAGAMSLGAGSIALEDEPPPPGLPLPESFAHARMPSSPALAPPVPSLQPPTLSLPQLPPIPAAKQPSGQKPEKRGDSLLDIDSFESLKER